MTEEIEFYGICPKRGCRTISGFSLTNKQIKEKGKYFCSECGKESILSKWKKSTKGAMDHQISLRRELEIIKKKSK